MKLDKCKFSPKFQLEEYLNSNLKEYKLNNKIKNQKNT